MRFLLRILINAAALACAVWFVPGIRFTGSLTSLFLVALVFGIMNAIYGLAWFAGSVLLGVLYDRSIVAVVLASMLFQAAALPIFAWIAARES